MRSAQGPTAATGPPARHVLVVGGAGYIGNVLTRALLARQVRVRCLDALLYDTGSAIAPLLEQPRFSFVRGDMRRPEVLACALAGVTDVVLLASLVGDSICNKYPGLARDVNVGGSIGTFEAAVSRGVERFVFVSTCSNYGVHGEAAATEESALDPRSLYTRTKVEFEQFLLHRSPAVPCTTAVLRLATAFGMSARMRFDLTVSDFARQLALGRELVVYDAHTWRPYCHVEDIASAVIATLEAERAIVAGQVFNVGADAENYTKAMLIAELRTLVPDARVRCDIGDTDVRNYRVSFSKIRETLGARPQRRVRESAAAVIEAVRAGLFADVDARPSFYGNCVIPFEEILRT